MLMLSGPTYSTFRFEAAVSVAKAALQVNEAVHGATDSGASVVSGARSWREAVQIRRAEEALADRGGWWSAEQTRCGLS